MKDKFYVEMAEKYGTPFYLFDLNELDKRVEKIHACIGSRASLCFAMKANPFLTEYLSKEVACLEVCSPGELQICKELEIPLKNIVLSGVVKEKQDIEWILNQDQELPIFTAESVFQYQMLCEMANKYNRKIDVLPRLTSGNQFGMDKDVLIDLVQRSKGEQLVEITGIHFFSGTQKRRAELIQAELDALDAALMEIEEKTSIKMERLEYGSGIDVEYFLTGKPFDEMGMLESLSDSVKKMKFQGNITIEMGRFIAASCGEFITQAREMKENAGVLYCLTDGGAHHLNYDGQVMAAKKPLLRQVPKRQEAELQEYNIYGALCSTKDVLVKHCQLKELKLGDLLVFEKTGAYSMTEGMSLFLSRDLPTVVSCKDGEDIMLRPSMPTYTMNF